MMINDVKTVSDLKDYCSYIAGKTYSCDSCPVSKDCAQRFSDCSSLIDFYKFKLSLILSYNRKQKLQKLLT